MKARTFFLITLLCAALASLQSIHANTITVTNTNDSGAGSLRQALVDAFDGDTINFDVAVTGTMMLTSGQLVVNKSVTIAGPGADSLAVNGNHASRVFYISSGKTVTISGLTITNGYSSDRWGGGIYNDHAALTVSNSAISGNSAYPGGWTGSGGGGGIFNYGSYGSGATLTVDNSVISGNSARHGGGIYNQAYAGNATVTISNSTVSGNAGRTGGGVVNTSGSGSEGTVIISNSTFSGNVAYEQAGRGGGVDNFAYAGSSATVRIGNTILKAGYSGRNIYNYSGTVSSLGYNLSSDDESVFLNQTGDLNSTDPMLDPLQDNGGPTFTYGLLTGSPAIDAGDPNFDPNNFTPPMIYDQRGPEFNRVMNCRIDIGAFEVQTPLVCPQLHGYWKDNPDVWAVTGLTLGRETYTKRELLHILRTRAGGDASLILAYQLIAAKLNIANCAIGTPVTSTITDADAVLSLYTGRLPYRVRPNSTDGQRMVSDGAVLDNYNNGLLTPGCTPTPTPTPSP